MISHISPTGHGFRVGKHPVWQTFSFWSMDLKGQNILFEIRKENFKAIKVKKRGKIRKISVIGKGWELSFTVTLRNISPKVLL